MMSWNMASQQNIRPSHSGLLLKWFLMTGAFSTGVKHSHKNNKISKTTKLQQCSKFVTLGNNKVLTCGCFKPSTIIPIDSWFFLTGSIHNKHKLQLSCIVSGPWCTDKFPWQKRNNLFFLRPTQHYSSPLQLPTEACYSLGWLHFKDTHTRPIISYLHKILGGNYYFYIQYKQGLAQAHTTLMTVVHDSKKLRESTTEEGPLFTMTWCIPKVSVCTLISTYLNHRSNLSPLQFTCQRSYIVINTVCMRRVALKTLANMCSPWWPVSLASVIYRLIMH